MGRSDRHKIYQAIKELHKETKVSISLLCKIANICRQAYYNWKIEKVTENEKLNKKLSNLIQEINNDVNGIYGYRRMTMNISVRTGESVNHKRIYRLMKKLGICSVIRKKRKKYLAVQPEQIAENILNRKFEATAPNENG
ncbi:IS3 family transposase [Cetobacterium sp.]|uniref:IS3 family transposase n=1 Tax=Cetobacterium sp. TaxID=2071632 RepID=UPI003F2DF445